ncbi:MAG: PP2C family protein-serine/threonine phosphatase [Candidatus Zixiibacteriota bacterium]
MHLAIVIFTIDLIDFLNLLKVDTVQEGFSGLVIKPFSSLVTWLMLLLTFIHTYQQYIFILINFIYILTAVYFLETGVKSLTNPRLLIQTKVILWATRIGLGLYVIAQLGSILLPQIFPDEIKSILLVFALLTGAGIFIFATIRYQFLDIRLIFRQSFVYTISSAILVGIYIVLVIQSKKLLVPIFGEQAQVISYAFIILILLLFQPINNWIDEFIRSLFIHTRTDHRYVIERFSRQVISNFNPTRLRQIIEETLKTTLLIEKVFFLLYDDKVKEYTLLPSEINPKHILIEREDLMLRGINLLDNPTYFFNLDTYKDNSPLAALLEERGTKLILPMKDSENLLGFLALTDKVAGYKFSPEDLNLLGVLSNQMVTALTNARLYVESLERIRLQEEVTMARQIQLDLLPSKPPDLKGLQISVHSTPSRTVGGDFFDFIEIDRNKVGIVIADASGKGMPAALLIAQTQAILRSEVHNGNSINEVLKNLNQQILKASSSEKYVTLFYGEYDTSCGRFYYANAGHNYPILLRANGELELLITGGPIIGALPMMDYQLTSTFLADNDILFLFTDGLSEAMNEKEEEYTEERIRQFIAENKHHDPHTIIDLILKDVRSYDPTYPPRDDMTIIALKVNNGILTNG